MQNKKELRKTMLGRRQQLTAKDQEQAAGSAMRHVLPLLEHSQIVMLYMPFRGELDTIPLARHLEEKGIGVAVPLTDQASRKITPVLLKATSTLVPGAYGILEPAAGHYSELPVTSLDAVLVPGVCFDQLGYRLGYGGGYYDRFLPKLRPDCLTIGYAYSWQVVERLPREDWDVKLTWVATDSYVLETRLH